jgi:hypothetical protein
MTQTDLSTVCFAVTGIPFFRVLAHLPLTELLWFWQG